MFLCQTIQTLNSRSTRSVFFSSFDRTFRAIDSVGRPMTRSIWPYRSIEPPGSDRNPKTRNGAIEKTFLSASVFLPISLNDLLDEAVPNNVTL